MLLSATQISFTSRPFQIFWVIVELLDLDYAFQTRVPIDRFTEYFLHQCFILQVHLPVHFEVVHVGAVLGQLKTGVNWDSADWCLELGHFSALVIHWGGEVAVVCLACRRNHLESLNDIISLQNVEIRCLQRFL